MINKKWVGLDNSRIKGLFASHDLTLEAVGKILYLTPLTVSRKINSQVPWKDSEIRRLAEYFNVSFEFLFGN